MSRSMPPGSGKSNHFAEDLAKQLGAAIRQARMTSTLPTQVDLAAALGIEQTRLSRWELGKVMPSHVEVRQLEIAMGLRRGELLIQGGLVDLGDRDAELALQSDHRLQPESRQALLSLFRAAVRAQQAVQSTGDTRPGRRG
jgi:ribosome-binding protein aMBF1 (putative translation factor)